VPVQPFTWPPDPWQLLGGPQGTAPRSDASVPTAPAFGWAPTSAAPSGSPTYPGGNDWSTTLGASSDADVPDPARITRLAEDARRAYEFAFWAFGPPSRGPAQRTRELTANPAPSTNTPAIPIAATAVAPSPQRADTQAQAGAQARSNDWQATHGIDTGPPGLNPPVPRVQDIAPRNDALGLDDVPAPTSRIIDLRPRIDTTEHYIADLKARTGGWKSVGTTPYWYAAHRRDVSQDPFPWLAPPVPPPTREPAAGPGPSISTPATPIATAAVAPSPQQADTQPWLGARARSNYWRATNGRDVGPGSEWTPEAQARAEMVTNRLFGLNGVERYHTFPERGVIDPFVNLVNAYEDGAFDPRNGVTPEAVEATWDAVQALAAGGIKFAKPGAAGIFGGQLSKTAARPALARAEQMEAAGVPASKIRQETGWGRGAEGQWKYEISDHNSRMIAAVKAGDQPVALGTRFEHPEFAKAYPHDWSTLKVVPLPEDVLLRRPDLLGRYNRATQTLELNPNMLPEKQRLVVLHELQHHVQAREGFARGGSRNTFEVIAAAEDVIAKQNVALTKERDALFAQRDQYIKDQQAARRNADAAVLEQEFWQQDPALRRRWGNIDHELNNTKGRISKEQFEQYKRLAGEVEARNVEKRADMPPAERRIRPPEDTAEHPYSDQLVLPPNPPPSPRPPAPPRPRRGYT
jgi:hypothetical protein